MRISTTPSQGSKRLLLLLSGLEAHKDSEAVARLLGFESVADQQLFSVQITRICDAVNVPGPLDLETLGVIRRLLIANRHSTAQTRARLESLLGLKSGDLDEGAYALARALVEDPPEAGEE